MKKSVFAIVFLLAMIGNSFAQSVANMYASRALAQFERDNPHYAGKSYLTGGNGERTWQEQMEFILKRGPAVYSNISRRFMNKFNMQLPAKVSDMTPDMLAWWEREIMAQAGKKNGFAHIGGKAQDISVRNLDSKGRILLDTYIRNFGMGILYEIPPDNYEAPIETATVFHCYVD